MDDKTASERIQVGDVRRLCSMAGCADREVGLADRNMVVPAIRMEEEVESQVKKLKWCRRAGRHVNGTR